MKKVTIILPEDKNLCYYGKFYKFLSVRSALKTLASERLRYSNPTIFNDPLDCSKFLFHFNASHPIISQSRPKTNVEQEMSNRFINDRYGKYFFESLDMLYNFKEIKNGITDEWRNKILQRLKQELFAREEIEKFRVSCFSKSYFSQKSFLMWSHYADSHKGICLEFNNKRVLSENSLKSFIPVVIQYENRYPIIRAESDFKANNWLWTKSKLFSYENEVRLLKKKDTTGRCSLLKFPKESLSKIIFGVNTSFGTIREVKDILKECYNIGEISFEKMRINEKTLKLIRAKYDIENLIPYKN